MDTIKIGKKYKELYKKVFFEIQNSQQSGYFDEAALPSYTHPNGLMSRLFWSRIQTALRLAGNITNQSVLDFGCGGGVTFLYLHENKCRISGCENQYPELSEEICRRLAVKAAICKDVFDLHAGYDTIFALDVLEHVPDIEKITMKLKELLADHGNLVVSGPTENIIYKLGRLLAGFSGHYHVRNIYDIEKQLKRLGLRKMKSKTLYWPVPLFRISCWEK